METAVKTSCHLRGRGFGLMKGSTSFFFRICGGRPPLGCGAANGLDGPDTCKRLVSPPFKTQMVPYP